MGKLLALICFIVLSVGCNQTSPDREVQAPDQKASKESTSPSQVSS